jgi:hypothetical protein
VSRSFRQNAHARRCPGALRTYFRDQGGGLRRRIPVKWPAPEDRPTEKGKRPTCTGCSRFHGLTSTPTAMASCSAPLWCEWPQQKHQPVRCSRSGDVRRHPGQSIPVALAEGGVPGTAGPAAAEEDARTDARQVYPVLDGLGRHGIRGICGLVSSFAALLLEARICQSHLRGYCCLAGGGEGRRLRPPTLGLALLLRLGLGLGTTHCKVQYIHHGEAAQVHCH